SYMTAAVSAANKLDIDSQYVTAVQSAFSTTSTECTSPVSAQTKKYHNNDVLNLVNACGGLDTCRAAQCKAAVVACSGKNSAASESNCLNSVVNSYSISAYTAKATETATETAANDVTIAQHNACIQCTGSNATKPIDRSAATSALTVLKTQCEIKEDDDEKDEDDDKSWWEKSGGATVGAAVGAIAGGVLANKVVGSIQDQELNNVERKAFEEFMNTVGSKIRCFVGPDEVGMYGEMISTSME
ncbi:MAG: hypothetical protein J6S12_00320, partial [Alphaproteobacteria bacterium]|nr:hypothetical protein [Alphaproteobacteria bacterium]